MASSDKEDQDYQGPLSDEPYVGDVVLGSFKLLEQLGCGAFATAYLAHQIGTDRKAVVKVPHRHLLNGERGDQIRARFSAELRASSRVNHPNIATVYTAGDTHGSIPVIAMEYIPGRSLQSVLKSRSPLRPRSVAKLAYQMASALGAIHDVGIVHRDVTPGNIILGSTANRNERYVLLDFGVARLSDRPSQTIGPLGTPRYMPREQIQGHTVPRSDMFALGAILWWAVTGREFLDEVDDVHSLLLRQAHRVEAPDPRSVDAKLAAPVCEALMRLLSTDPSARPSAREFVAEWPGVMRAWAAELKRERSGGSPVPTDPNSASKSGPMLGPMVGSDTESTPNTPAHALIEGGHSAEYTAVEDRDDYPEIIHVKDPDDDDDEKTMELAVPEPRPLSALIIDTNPVRRSALVASLGAENWDVVEADPGAAPDVAFDRSPALIVCSQSLDDRTGIEVLQAIRHRLGWRSWPTSVLIVRKDGAPENWQDTAEHCVVLPDEFDALRQVLDTVQPASLRDKLAASGSSRPDDSRAAPPVTDEGSRSGSSALESLSSFGPETLRATIGHFGGVMPEWLQDLSEAIDSGDGAAVSTLSRRIREAGEMVGADHLARLGEIVAQLGEAGLYDQISGFIAEIEAEFNRVFRELLQIDGIHS